MHLWADTRGISGTSNQQGGKLTIDPTKAEGLRDWPRTLTKVKQVQIILGVLGYQRPFIPNHTTIAKPLSDLTKKDHPFTWTPECRKALDTLINIHIMDSHGLCNWYSQPTLRVLHNSYSSWRLPTLRFFLTVFDTLADGWPVRWSAVHEMDHLAVCDMMSGQLSFLLYHWKAVICSFLTIDHIYL